MFLFSYQICSILEWYMVNENIWTDMTMSGIQLHSHVPSHTSIYLSMLSFLSNIKKFVLQFPFCIDHFDVILQKIRKRYTSVVFICFCLPSFGDCNENQLRKDFCWIENKQTHSLHISAQWLKKLRQIYYKLTLGPHV